MSGTTLKRQNRSHNLPLLLWIGGVWRLWTASAYNLSKSSCRYQWGRDRWSKLLGCGDTSCGFDVHSDEGVRGVKKVYYANASAVRKDKNHSLSAPPNRFVFRSAVETLQKLEGECSISPALDICDGDGGYLPYVVYAWRGHTTIQSYYLDTKRPIPGHLLLSWFDYAMQNVAPCVANRGLVVWDTRPRHALVDPSGLLIPAGEFVLIDPDGYSPSEFWGRNSAQVNNTAAFVNRLCLGALFMRSILQDCVYSESDRQIVNYLNRHVGTLMVMNEYAMRSIDAPEDFFRKTFYANLLQRKVTVLSQALAISRLRATKNDFKSI